MMSYMLSTQFRKEQVQDHLKAEHGVVVFTLHNGGAIRVTEQVKFDGLDMIGEDSDGDKFIVHTPEIVALTLTTDIHPEGEDMERQMHEWQELLAELRVACGESEDPAVKAALAKLEEYEGGNGAN